MTLAFTPWPKTPRLFRDATITEKIDGTNAAVVIQKHPFGAFAADGYPPGTLAGIVSDQTDESGMPVSEYIVAAQSRNRLVLPGGGNHMGFVPWVEEHAADLARQLGEGVHFGEWWGSGIQRGYGLAPGDKRFSLFNVHRYSKALPTHEQDPRPRIPGLGLVPVLSQRTFDTDVVRATLADLEALGSQAAPGFMKPEGVVVYHSAANQVFKALIENDDKPKGT